MPTLDTTETAILSRAIDPAQASWSPAAACSILDIKLTQEDAKRHDELAEKARQGTLSEEEAAELRNYGQVGRILELMKAKAKVSLSKTTIAS
jgi:uncharacterized protein YnzC (UPF0291/DUF896 family)